jgi:hypothetical protein
MNTTPFATALMAAVALGFSASAAAETYTFSDADIFQNEWTNPVDGATVTGFRVGTSIFDYWSGETPSVPTDIGFTAFSAADYHWENSTIVFGFAASPNLAYDINWADSWLTLNDGTRIDLGSVAPTQAGAALAADIWGGGGLNLATTWVFDVPAEISSIAGGSITYNVTSVPEPETWAMLLAGFGLVGTIARRRARKF